jgi:enoyl-CoA hydratase/carnithine racemase
VFPRGGRPVVELVMHDDGIAFVQMRDDDAANMFTADLLAGLREAFAEIENLSAAKVVVVAGTETWFCCGGTPEDLARMREGRASFFGIDGFRLLLDCSLPTIAAMRGHAVGGGLTFGLYADVALLADNAYYSANFMEHGLTPGIGTTYILPKKLGAALGAEMMLTAQRYQGLDLKARGVQLEVLAKDAVLPRAFALAREIAKSPVRQIKLLKRRSTEETRRDLPRVLREEDSMHALCFPRPSADAPRGDREGNLPVYPTLIVERRDAFWSITLNRPEARNSIDEQLLADLHAVLDEIEGEPSAKVLVLCGQPPVFCTGLDFHASTAAGSARTTVTSRFMALMKRLSSIPKIVVALVDGDVMAGGIGLVAASDFVFATSRSTFALTEALWGLMPAMVLPFMIRRTGFGAAYAMTLSASTIGAEAACAMRLVDEVIGAHEADSMRFVERKARRFERLEASTIGAIKAYFRELWIVDEATEQRAVGEINRLLSDPVILKKMKDYTETGRLPWEHERQ